MIGLMGEYLPLRGKGERPHLNPLPPGEDLLGFTRLGWSWFSEVSSVSTFAARESMIGTPGGYEYGATPMGSVYFLYAYRGFHPCHYPHFYWGEDERD